jgi:hypothetical protein
MELDQPAGLVQCLGETTGTIIDDGINAFHESDNLTKIAVAGIALIGGAIIAGIKYLSDEVDAEKNAKAQADKARTDMQMQKQRQAWEEKKEQNRQEYESAIKAQDIQLATNRLAYEKYIHTCEIKHKKFLELEKLIDSIQKEIALPSTSKTRKSALSKKIEQIRDAQIAYCLEDNIIFNLQQKIKEMIQEHSSIIDTLKKEYDDKLVLNTLELKLANSDNVIPFLNRA